jgi:AraC-like DNA-binding protein
MISLLPLETLEKVLAAADEAGVPRDWVTAEAGIRNPLGAAGIPYHDLAAAYEAAARLTGDAAFGLHLGERTAFRMYGLLGYLVANSVTLGEALTSLVAYQGLWSRGAGFEIERGGGRLRLRYWSGPGVPAEGRRQESEQMLSALITFVRSAVGISLRPAEVRFEHSAPADTREHERIFGCRLLFGASATELSIAADRLDLPVPEADPNLARLLRRQAEVELGDRLSEQPFVRALQSLAGAAILSSGDASLEGLAAAAGLGPRTLQRRLQREGLTVRTLVAQTRAALARRFLEEGELSLGQIAFRLGYAQTSAFHRAFRRETGSTPRRAARLARSPRPS